MNNKEFVMPNFETKEGLELQDYEQTFSSEEELGAFLARIEEWGAQDIVTEGLTVKYKAPKKSE